MQVNGSSDQAERESRSCCSSDNETGFGFLRLESRMWKWCDDHFSALILPNLNLENKTCERSCRRPDLDVWKEIFRVYTILDVWNKSTLSWPSADLKTRKTSRWIYGKKPFRKLWQRIIVAWGWGTIEQGFVPSLQHGPSPTAAAFRNLRNLVWRQHIDRL